MGRGHKPQEVDGGKWKWDRKQADWILKRNLVDRITVTVTGIQPPKDDAKQETADAGLDGLRRAYSKGIETRAWRLARRTTRLIVGIATASVVFVAAGIGVHLCGGSEFFRDLLISIGTALLTGGVFLLAGLVIEKALENSEQARQDAERWRPSEGS